MSITTLRSGVDLGDLADETGTVGDRHADGDSGAGADGDLDGVLEVARCLTHHLGDHALVAVNRREVVQLEQLVVLGDGGLRLDLGTLFVFDLIVSAPRSRP